MTEATQRTSDNGVSIWLDDLSRSRIESGSLQDLIDVYKRQPYGNPSAEYRGLAAPPLIARRVEAVSYTHLDVYKRQVVV